MGTFFARFLKLKWWGITICLLGTSCSTVCPQGGGLGGEDEGGATVVVRGHFLLNLSQGSATGGTEGVRCWTSLCSAIVKPQSQREKETRKHWWTEKRAWGSKTRWKHRPAISSTCRGLSDHCISFHLESNCTNLPSEFLPQAQISAHFLSLIGRFNP